MAWNVAEAKAKFSELVTKSGEGPQMIRNRGKEVAVVLSVEEFERLTRGRRDDQVTSAPAPTRVPMVTRIPMTSPGVGSFRVEED